MATFGVPEQPASRPFRDRVNEGLCAGLENGVSNADIEDIVRILSAVPVTEWFQDETRQYAIGLLEAWLQEQYNQQHQQMLLSLFAS